MKSKDLNLWKRKNMIPVCTTRINFITLHSEDILGNVYEGQDDPSKKLFKLGEVFCLKEKALRLIS